MVEHTGTVEVQERERFLLGKKETEMERGSWYKRRHLPGTLEKQVKEEPLGFVPSVLFTAGKCMSLFRSWSENPLMECGRPSI